MTDFPCESFYANSFVPSELVSEIRGFSIDFLHSESVKVSRPCQIMLALFVFPGIIDMKLHSGINFE